MLEIKNITKRFGDNLVLDNVSLTVAQDEVVVIMGESGIGKSTLLRCIANLETIDDGTISIDGNLSYPGKIGFVFQNFNLFPHKTIFDNCLEPLLINKVDHKTAISRVNDYLTKLKILDKSDQYPYQLSGGQKQRAAIARSCVLLPQYICIDEPTSALDEKSTQDVVEVIQTIAKQQIGILIVTHDMAFAKQVATKIITIEK